MTPLDCTVSDNKLFVAGKEVDFQQTPNRAGQLNPTVIVLHDTAGCVISKKTSVNWFMNPNAKASAHLVVERDGDVTQCSRFNTVCWHAGRSVYKGRPSVNQFGIGIEICNPGLLKRGSDGKLHPWFNSESYSDKEYRIESHDSTGYHPAGYYMHYTDKQLELVFGAVRALCERYPIEAITTHWEISPGAKIDTNPLFPLAQLKSFAFGRGVAKTDSRVLMPRDAGHPLVVAKYKINVRATPSFMDDNIIGTEVAGAKLEVLEATKAVHREPGREFTDLELWYKVKNNEHGEGWVFAENVNLLT
jgi:N-acetylmuramoyl-L-alanine amidase